MAVALAVAAAGGAGAMWMVNRDDDGASVASADGETEEVTGVPGGLNAGVEQTTVLQAVEATTGTFTESVTLEGTVAAAETESLSFSSAGTVTAVNVAVGDTVSAGRILATIDSAELEAALADAQATYADAAAKLADDTDADASDEQIASDEARLAVAADDVTNAETALADARLTAGISGTVTAVNLTVGEQLGSSGTSGVSMSGSGSGSGMSSASVGSGGRGAAGGATTSTSAQIELTSVGRFSVTLTVDSSEIESLAVGESATVSAAESSSSSTSQFGFPGGTGGGGFGGGNGGGAMPDFAGGMGQQMGGGQPGSGDQDASTNAGDDESTQQSPMAAATTAATATGTVTEIGTIADSSSGVAGFPVTIEFTDDSGELLIGSSVAVEITTSERTDVVQVPRQAVTTVDGVSTVTVAVDGDPDGEVETRTVETGEANGMMIEIVSGLEAGESVVVEQPVMGNRGNGADQADGEAGAQAPTQTQAGDAPSSTEVAP